MTTNQLIQSFTAPGAPFEYASAVVAGQEVRVFKNAQPCLSRLYSGLQNFSDSELAVFDQRRLSYAQAYKQAASLANDLQNRFGIRQGARVAIVMRNCPEWLVSFIAVTSLGAVAALVNSRGAADEIAYSVKSTGCELILTDHKTADGLELNQLSPAHIVFDIQQSYTGLSHTGEALAVDAEAVLPRVDCDQDDTALILFTSGTTGRPKGALLSHRGVMNALKANEFSSAIIGAGMAAKLGIDLATLAANAPQTSVLLMFPLFHVSGCYSVFLANLVRGGKLVMLSRWEAETALQAIETERVTMFPGVPTMYWDLLNFADRQNFDLSSMTSLSVAGQSTPVSLLRQIQEAFPNATVGSGYGMTETNGVIAMIIGDEFLDTPESVGQPLSLADIKISDELGNAVSSGETGEICVRGATVMHGYDNQPEANSKCFKDGWFHTGDVGYLDQTGKLYVVDRLTEMIISGGENIYCAEVERVLNQAPDVIELTTFGLPDERLGERLVAMVRLQSDSSTSEDDLLTWSAKSLASYKVPSEVLIIDQPLARNATGKVLKVEAKKLYQSITGVV